MITKAELKIYLNYSVWLFIVQRQKRATCLGRWKNFTGCSLWEEESTEGEGVGRIGMGDGRDNKVGGVESSRSSKAVGDC